jgi:ribosomal protein L44E
MNDFINITTFNQAKKIILVLKCVNCSNGQMISLNDFLNGNFSVCEKCGDYLIVKLRKWKKRKKTV